MPERWPFPMTMDAWTLALANGCLNTGLNQRQLMIGRWTEEMSIDATLNQCQFMLERWTSKYQLILGRWALVNINLSLKDVVNKYELMLEPWSEYQRMFDRWAEQISVITWTLSFVLNNELLSHRDFLSFSALINWIFMWGERNVY